MPRGVAAADVRHGVESALLVDGDELRTTRPLWEIPVRSRVRLVEEFVDRHVEVEIWPERKADDPHNYTQKWGRVLSSAWNPRWGDRGLAVLVLEFPVGMTKKDLPIPMHTVASIRTVTPEEEDDGEVTSNDDQEPGVLPDRV